MRLTLEEARELGVAEELQGHDGGGEDLRLRLLARTAGRPMTSSERQAAHRRRQAAIAEVLKDRCRRFTAFERRCFELTGVPLKLLFDPARGDAGLESLLDAARRARQRSR